MYSRPLPWSILTWLVLTGILTACQTVRVDISTGDYPPFIKAAQQGDIAEVERLLKEGQLVNQRTIGDETALHVAAAESQDLMVTWLLAHDANPIARTQNGETPADFVRTEAKTSTQKLILDFIELLKSEEEAIAKGNIERLRQLLSQDVRQYTVLHILIQHGNVEAVKREIESGADVNAKTVMGITPLHKVIVTGNTDLAKLLLSAGADVNARDIYNGTPLYYAITFNNKDLVELYLEMGADTSIQVTWGNENALETAQREGNPEIIALIRRNATQP